MADLIGVLDQANSCVIEPDVEELDEFANESQHLVLKATYYVFLDRVLLLGLLNSE